MSKFAKGNNSKIVSDYDQEVPQSQTADNPTAHQGRVAQVGAIIYTEWLEKSNFHSPVRSMEFRLYSVESTFVRVRTSLD